VVLSSTLARLLLAAILGGIIGLERNCDAGRRVCAQICYLLRRGHVHRAVSPTRGRGIRQRAPSRHRSSRAFGFIGARSILHARASVQA